MSHYTFEKTSAGSSPVNSDSRATGTGTAPAVKCIASFCLDFLAACKIQCSKSVQVLCHLETYNIYYTSSGEQIYKQILISQTISSLLTFHTVYQCKEH